MSRSVRPSRAARATGLTDEIQMSRGTAESQSRTAVVQSCPKVDSASWGRRCREGRGEGVPRWAVADRMVRADAKQKKSPRMKGVDVLVVGRAEEDTAGPKLEVRSDRGQARGFRR